MRRAELHYEARSVGLTLSSTPKYLTAHPPSGCKPCERRDNRSDNKSNAHKPSGLFRRSKDTQSAAIGAQFKVTGYERAAIWARHPERAPSQVNVIVVPVADAEEAGCLYDDFERLLDRELM